MKKPAVVVRENPSWLFVRKVGVVLPEGCWLEESDESCPQGEDELDARCVPSRSAKTARTSSSFWRRDGLKSRSSSNTSTWIRKGARSAEFRTTDSEGEMRTMRECG